MGHHGTRDGGGDRKIEGQNSRSASEFSGLNMGPGFLAQGQDNRQTWASRRPRDTETCIGLRIGQATGLRQEYFRFNCETDRLSGHFIVKCTAVVPAGVWGAVMTNAWASVSNWSFCPSPNQQFVDTSRRSRQLHHASCLSLPWNGHSLLVSPTFYPPCTHQVHDPPPGHTDGRAWMNLWDGFKLGFQRGGAKGSSLRSPAGLTCDDVTELVLTVMLAQEVSEANHHQSCNGGQDAHPLAWCQPPAQEGH